MSAIHIRNVSPEILEALKRRAKRHHRSLQQELHLILKNIAEAEPAGTPVSPIRLHFSKAKTDSTWRREEIYDDGR